MRPYNVNVVGDGVPLLLINGAFHDRTMFAPFATGLAEDFKVITFDYPNQAKGTYEPSLLDVKDYAEITHAALAEAGVAAADTVVFGLSSGANVARYMHCCQRMDFKALALAGPNPGGMEGFYARLHGEYIKSIRDSGLAGFSRMAMFMFFSPHYHCREPRLGDLLNQRVQMNFGDNAEALVTLIQSLFHDDTRNAPPTDFRCPTLFLRGTEDQLAPKSIMEKYVARCTGPQIELVEVTGGHAFPMESHSQTESRIRRFLEKSGLDVLVGSLP